MGSSWHSEDRASQEKFIHHVGAHVMTGNDPAGRSRKALPGVSSQD